MQYLTGYEIQDVIHETRLKKVVRAIRLSDNKIVVIKTLKDSPAPTEEVARLVREYEIAKKIAFPGIISVFDLLFYGHNNVAIIMEFFAESVDKFLKKEEEFYLSRFFIIASELVKILGILHSRNIIHKDINPRNILIDSKSNRVKIIDFGISSELPHERQSMNVPKRLEGSLPYISPEQTGRINRGLDYRADYYSLGVSFFEMLTGQVPFKANDVMGWVYCHISRDPPHASKFNPQVPVAIELIILKLMAKNPEDRYQSSVGLLKDLEFCQKSWLENGRIDGFQPGKWDISEMFQIPQKIYGREKEIDTLISTFDRVAEGSTELLLVSGYSGVGKSALLHELYSPIVRKHGYFIEGKVDQLEGNTPFKVLGQAFRHLIHQLMAESSDRLDVWKAKLLQSFGPNGQIILNLVPDLEIIVGKQPSVQELGPVESQNRFNIVLHDFIKVFADAEHPLVILLDDMHWCDIPTLNLLQYWLKSSDLSHLLILAAYRDNEVSAIHPLMLALDEISKFKEFQTLRLKPLDENSINQMVTETFWSTSKKCSPLANLLHSKTEGNPFFVGELLKEFYRQKGVWFNPGNGCWEWDIKILQRAKSTSNVVDFLINTLHTFSNETQHILSLAACIGNIFDLRTLSIIYEKSMKETNSELFSALHAGLIFPLSEDYKFIDHSTDYQPPIINPQYLFQHDRVQQAAYLLIDESIKQAVHLAIGRLMLTHFSDQEQEERLVDIIKQLNEGRSLITSQEEKDQLVRLNLKASIKAKNATAYQSALEYLKIAYSLLDCRPWENQYDLVLDISMEYSQCAYLSGQIEEADNFIETMHKYARSDINKIEIYYLQQRHYLILSRMDDAIRVGIESLNLMGIKIPYRPNFLSILKEYFLVKLNLRRRKISELINLPEMTDNEKKMAIRAMSEMSPAVYNTGNENLVLFLSFKMLNISLCFGNSMYSSYSYFVYGNFLTNYVGKPEDGYEFGKLSVAINEKYSDKALECRTLYTYNFFIRPWNEHWEELTVGFQKTVESGYQSGDLFFLAYASILLYAWNPRIALKEKIDHLSKSIQICRSTSFDVAIDASTLTHQANLNYCGATDSRFSMNVDGFNENECIDKMRLRNDVSGIAYYHYFKSDIFFLYEEYREALVHIMETEKYESVIKGCPAEARACIVNFFTCTAIYKKSEHNERKRLKKRLQKAYKKMKRWADHCPANFLHIRLAMDAEFAALEDKPLTATKLYSDAVAKAKEGGWRQDEGMILMLACKFYLDRDFRIEASAYLRDAYTVYLNWGAYGKLEFLEEMYSNLLQEKKFNIPNSKTISTEKTIVSLDLDTLFKASQTLSEEVMLDKLLQKLMDILCENAGAEVGYLLLPSPIDWHIVVSYIGCQTDVLLEQVPLSETASLPQSIVTYVKRTKEHIVLHDACQNRQFMEDLYIRTHQTKSVVCLPLLHQGKFTAILYLENNLVSGVFTPSKLELLQLLGSQAAISLENAALYANLEEKIQERTTELSKANNYLQKEIKERQLAENVAQQAKDEAEHANQVKSIFLANMSHELRTPLNGIMGYAQILKRKKDLQKDCLDGLNIIYNSGQHLLALINDVLDLAKIEAGKMELYPESVNLQTLIGDVVGVMRMAAHKKNLQFVHQVTNDMPIIIECDKRRLRQVLLNLLSNAIKFTENGGTVKFHVSTVNCTEDASWQSPRATLRFLIQDTGVGMAPEQQAIIFKPFEQVGNVSQRGDGTGLGLPITRQLVNMMGGNINIESSIGNGSTFWFEICVPVYNRDISSPLSNSEQRSVIGYEGAIRTILVVDDHLENRMVFINLLAPLGFQMLSAENGQEGLQLARIHRPDLILADLVMPMMSGLDMVKQIRVTDDIRDVPIIAVSASVHEVDQENCRQLGCQAFLSKPIDADSLYAVIAKHVGVKWVYEILQISNGINDVPVSTEADIIPPPQKDLEELYELTMFGNLERVQEQAEAIALRDARYQAFVRIIYTHAQKLEDEPILELLAHHLGQQ